MRRSATELRGQILDAARAEFARHGLAGSRIDRIAREAHASKERLYAHFGDKETLFREVVDTDVTAFYRSVTLRPDAVPEFAGDVYDLGRNSPEHLRMITWARLKDWPSTSPTPTGRRSSSTRSPPSKPPRPTGTSTAPGSLSICWRCCSVSAWPGRTPPSRTRPSPTAP